VPPQFPEGCAGDREVALKYLEAYQAYLAVFSGEPSSVVSVRSRNRPGKKKRSAARKGDKRAFSVSSSQLTYSGRPAGETSAEASGQSGRGLDSASCEVGEPCYLRCVRPECRADVAAGLGDSPTFRSLLLLPSVLFVSRTELLRMSFQKFAEGLYGVVPHGPTVYHTLVAIVAASSEDYAPGSLASELVGEPFPDVLVGKCPSALAHVGFQLPSGGEARVAGPEVRLGSSPESLTPSRSVSQTGVVAPAIVRVDSRDSLKSFTAPNSPSEYVGLVVGEAIGGPGFCYGALVRPECLSAVQDRLGPDPSFGAIMGLERSMLLSDELLARMQVSRVQPGRYHVVTGTVMPGVVSTLAAVAKRAPGGGYSGESVYSWAVLKWVDERLIASAPSLSDVVGADRMEYYYDERLRANVLRYPPGYDPWRGYPTLAYDLSGSSGYGRASSSQAYITEAVRDEVSRGLEREPEHRSRRRRSHRSHRRHDSGRSGDGEAVTYDGGGYQGGADVYPGYEYIVAGVQNLGVSGGAAVNGGNPGSPSASSSASAKSVRVAGSLQGVQCAVCIEVISEGGGFLSCGHVFHAACVDSWLEQSGSCPTCRAAQ